MYDSNETDRHNGWSRASSENRDTIDCADDCFRKKVQRVTVQSA